MSNDIAAPSRLYAYEVPPVQPGDYEIITKQVVEAAGQKTEELISTQPLTVKACSPYALSPDLIHSYYPPNMHTVSANTLPHIVLKGATPWERSQDLKVGSGCAPTPWLALLLFTESELCAPPEVMSSSIRPSGTKSLTLPFPLFNSNRGKFCHRDALSDTDAIPKPDGSQTTADFIFVKGSAFKMYFERQSSKPGEQVMPELDRYSLLTVMTDTGERDSTGHTNKKLSTILGHRTRPFTPGSEKAKEKVYAHIVSIENLEKQIDWKVARQDSATVALLSLFSWTFTWDGTTPDSPLEMFAHLAKGENIRSLSIPITKAEDTTKISDPSSEWVRERVDEGFTIVRHRDIAGEASMALYRGPLIPRSSRRAHIKPSLHGTDLQIIDVSAKVIDVSYSTAWELGRSLAGRDSQFSAAMAVLRRKLCMKAVTTSRTPDGPEADSNIVYRATDVVDSVLEKLDNVFNAPLESKIKGLPLNTEDKQKAARWNVPQHSATSMAVAPGVLTMAKLKRHLQNSVRTWIEGETTKLWEAPGKTPEAPQLAFVYNWIISNLMSFKLVPALYLFPDPAVLVSESLSCFLVDDVWVDALVDGAMSLANTMGGGEDPVRDEVRRGFNCYLKKSPPGLVQIGGSGFVLRSGIVESFPDLDITITTTAKGSSAPIPLSCTHRTKNDDMILCLVARDKQQKLVDYTVKLKLPPHQQKYVVESVSPKDMTFTCVLDPFLKPDNVKPLPGAIKVRWTSDGKIDPPTLSFSPMWSWSTGVLAPHVVVNMMNYFMDKSGEYKWNKPSPDSTSVYLATQLTDRNYSVVVNLNVTQGKAGMPREIMPETPPSEDDDDTRDKAVFHDPQSKSNNEIPSGEVASASSKSWFTKRAFSQEYPGLSIPAMSNNTQHLIFSVKPTTSAALPKDTEVLSMEFSIPLGEQSFHLLDHLAPLPTVKAISTRQQWVAAVTHKKSAAEIVVHLKPRGRGGATLSQGLDASFMLVNATVNGVMGHDVVIDVKEVYAKVKTIIENGKEVVVTTNKTTVNDSWVLEKE